MSLLGHFSSEVLLWLHLSVYDKNNKSWNLTPTLCWSDLEMQNDPSQPPCFLLDFFFFPNFGKSYWTAAGQTKVRSTEGLLKWHFINRRLPVSMLFFFYFKLSCKLRRRKGGLEPFACRIMAERTAENGRKSSEKLPKPPQKWPVTKKSVELRLS